MVMNLIELNNSMESNNEDAPHLVTLRFKHYSTNDQSLAVFRDSLSGFENFKARWLSTPSP
jgi:hypothetical protein